jgi:hypothetical protein
VLKPRTHSSISYSPVKLPTNANRELKSLHELKLFRHLKSKWGSYYSSPETCVEPSGETPTTNEQAFKTLLDGLIQRQEGQSFTEKTSGRLPSRKAPLRMGSSIERTSSRLLQRRRSSDVCVVSYEAYAESIETSMLEVPVLQTKKAYLLKKTAPFAHLVPRVVTSQEFKAQMLEVKANKPYLQYVPTQFKPKHKGRLVNWSESCRRVKKIKNSKTHTGSNDLVYIKGCQVKSLYKDPFATDSGTPPKGSASKRYVTSVESLEDSLDIKELMEPRHL